METDVIAVELTDTAADHGAAALIAPLGIDDDRRRLQAFEPPAGWRARIVAERRTGQLAAVLEPPSPTAIAHLRHSFAAPGVALAETAFAPEATALAHAAADLAEAAGTAARGAGGGLAGVAAIVADVAERFDYGDPADGERLFTERDAVPIVACALGNCIDINTYLTAALRAAGFEAAYLTCYFFADDPNAVPSGMHCWVRSRVDGVLQDWDIAHFKKAGRADVAPMRNPIPGRRYPLAYGSDHAYPWRGLEIRVPTPSRPVWVRADGRTIWGAPPILRLSRAERP